MARELAEEDLALRRPSSRRAPNPKESRLTGEESSVPLPGEGVPSALRPLADSEAGYAACF